MSKVILYIATSQDGFIADSQGGVDWLPQPKTSDDLEEVGYNHLMERVDTIVMGSRSYKQIIGFGEWAWADKKTWVFTSRQISNDSSCIHFTNDLPKEFMQKVKSDKDIWLLGGAELAQSFAKENLIDEIILTIISAKLDKGIPLGLSLDNFDLNNEKKCIAGMIQRTYLKR